MTTPSLHQSLGLSVAYSDPLVKSPRSACLGELRAEVNEYEHETAAVGGYLTARFDLVGDMVDVNDWFEHGIGRHVEVASPDLVIRWEGFVNSATVSAGQYGATRGPLVEIANRTGAFFNERDTSVDPPVVIPGRETIIVEDAGSQSVYGVWEKWVSAGETNMAGAEQTRDSFLRENAHPTADDPRIAFEAGGQVSVSVECLGYWAWMQGYPYQDVAGSGTVTAQTKVQSILAADPNGIFSVDYSHVDYNAYLAPRYENSNTPAWEVMKSLAAIGDAADNRWLFGVYADRTAYYRQVPDVEKYQHRLSDPSQRLETIIGGEVAPWDIEPGEWIYLPDFLTGRGPALTVADMRQDERYVFIESVRFRAPCSAEITGTRVGKLVQILAKRGVGGLGG